MAAQPEVPSAATLERIDGICLRFEDDWKAGSRPALESSLAELPESQRQALFRELLRLDLHYRRQKGETPAAAEYEARFPAYHSVVAEALRPPPCSRCGSATPTDARSCPACGVDLSVAAAAVAATIPGQPHENGGEAPAATPSTLESSSFLPGAIVAGRYRIVALLGRGGMGEVYRADDLKLGQPVALKFLPVRLAQDPERRECLLNEVRLGRRVAHPNVCRVFDIGEVAEQPFLSMEYVDGEDLARLLRRVGRLSPERGLLLAKQLAMGLAAAHAEGVLHCDLKPANVLLDGRGQVRITDFGIARLLIAPAEQRLAGTPAYMAPETLRGAVPTVSSDLYALGLVLYELFTGQAAFPAVSFAELLSLKRQVDFRPAPSHLAALDPAVERIIFQCLRHDPQARPMSAQAVLAVLPGGPVLEATVAAGDTPSPEMVAAGGERGDVSPLWAGLSLAGVMVGLVVVALLAGPTGLLGQVRLEPPEVLIGVAHQALRELGPASAPVDRAFGFAYADEAEAADPIYFWYRQAPARLVPVLFAGSLSAPGDGTVTLRDPPPTRPGERSVRLDPGGRLLEIRVLPGDEGDKAGRPVARPETAAGIPAWCVPLFRLAGLTNEGSDVGDFRSIPVSAPVPVPADDARAWQGACPQTGATVHVLAASYRGQPVYFHWRPVTVQPAQAAPTSLALALRRVTTVILVLGLLLVAVVLVRHNLRHRRGDRRSAWRLASYGFCATLCAWILQTSRSLIGFDESIFFMGLQLALYWAAILWLFYLAMEPFVRRLWPSVLIAWSRLLAGSWRDPLVGREVLLGILLGVATRILWQINILAPGWLGWGPTTFGIHHGSFRVPLETLLSPAQGLGELCRLQVRAILGSLTVLLLIFSLRAVLRRQELAATAYIALGIAVWPIGVGNPYVSWITAGLTSALVFYLVTHLGLLALVTYTGTRLLLNFPITADLSVWYAGATSLFALGVIALLASAAAYLTMRPRLLLPRSVSG